MSLYMPTKVGDTQPLPSLYDLKILIHHEDERLRLTVIPKETQRYLLCQYPADSEYREYALDEHYTRVVLTMREGDTCLIIAPRPDFRSCRLLCKNGMLIALDTGKQDEGYLTILCNAIGS